MAPEVRSAREIGRRVLELEAEALRALVDRLDEGFDRAVEMLATCEGRVVFLGVGKSGLVCRKIAATLSSTGTPALFVHPTDALHGDLGGIAPGDVVACASASGETEELVRVMPLLRQVADGIIALCGRRDSRIARAADAVLDVSVPGEACPLGLAPTASSTAMLAMGDALAMALAQRKGFTQDDFGRLHPGGSLGRRLLKVADLMHAGSAMPVVSPLTPMREVIHEISAKGLGMTTVVEDGRLAGVISDGDLRRLLEREEHPLEVTAAEVMSRGARTVAPETPASRAIELMEGPPRRIQWLVVVDEQHRPLGVVRLHDILAPRS